MGQIVTINGKPLECQQEPYLRVGQPPKWRTPIEINGKMVYGVNINGYDYPPADTGSLLYYPGLPGQGSTIWDRSNQSNHGTLVNATWVRLPSGLPVLNLDGDDCVTTGQPIIPNTTFTISIWQKNSETQNFLSTVWSKYLTTAQELAMFYYGYDAPFLCAGSSAAVPYRVDALANSDLGWHKVTWVNNAGTNTIYVDGVLSQTRTVNAGPVYGDPANTFAFAFTGNAARLFTLGRGYNDSRYYKGRIALPQVLNVARTAAQELAKYQQERVFFGV